MGAIAVRASRLKLITPYQGKMFWIRGFSLDIESRAERAREGDAQSAEADDRVPYQKTRLQLGRFSKAISFEGAGFQEMYRAEIVGDPPPGRVSPATYQMNF